MSHVRGVLPAPFPDESTPFPPAAGGLRRRVPACFALVLAATAGACGGGAPRAGAATAAAGAATTATPLPPATDIWLAELHHDPGGALSLGRPVNATHRRGYDNQPFFLPDGSGFWYTSIDSTGQADIWYHDLASGENRPVTRTARESEYSPTWLGMGGGFSAIRVEADSTQRLWRFDVDGANASVLFPNVAPVGYHAWADDHTVVMYVLGTPPTLVVGDVSTGATRTVARDVGRSIQRIPGTNDVSYVQRVGKDSTEIRRLDVRAGTSTPLAPGIRGGDFHAWTPDGVLLQAHGAGLYAWSPGAHAWRQIADLSAQGISLSRLAVSPDGTRIALVGETAGGS
jgi:hypothetical protein